MIDFPNTPTLNQIHTAAGCNWRWDGAKWVVGGGGPGSSAVDVANGSKTLATGFSGTVRIENTTNAPITINMPASPTSGQQILLKDSTGNASLYPATIAGNGAAIEGGTTLVLSYNYSWVTLYHTGAKWVQV